MDDYASFLASKRRVPEPFGFKTRITNSAPFDWQRQVVRWAVRRGRAALFEECGLGKTLQQLLWAEAVTKHVRKPVVIHTPVGVRGQTMQEATKFNIGVDVTIANVQADVRPGINLINYEKLDKFDPKQWGGVVLDESSILKNYTGKTKQALCDAYKFTPYRLACTATPAPNDHMELGNHSEFLGIMPSSEMLSRWFINDTMKAGGYRLRGHARKEFWQWVASWAVCIAKPSDIGGSDEGFNLPELRIHRHIVEDAKTEAPAGWLFDVQKINATNLYSQKKATAEQRVAKAAELATGHEPVLIWCDTNDESSRLVAAIDDAIEVRGDMSEDEKESRLRSFSEGKARVMVTKPSIAGFGMNWQHCRRQIFAGITFSFEAYYQAVRRCWRFGQYFPVDVHLILAEGDSALESSIGRKENDHKLMQAGMVEAMRWATGGKLLEELRPREYHHEPIDQLPSWLHTRG